MVHEIDWRVASPAALDFWSERLAAAGVASERSESSLGFRDPEGLHHELLLSSSPDPPLSASAPGIPAEHALQGFDGVRAYSSDPARSEALLADTLGFSRSAPAPERWEVRGSERGGFYTYDPAPPAPPRPGGGTVHHVAFASKLDEHEAWQRRVAESGAHPTPVIDRFYFHSIYFREPSGVLFEIATIGPGFAVDEDPEHLGEHLSLPPPFEPLRGRLEQELAPLPYPRPA
jgi:glyoxalase family protein